ncbi:MAG: hypothetical protein HFI19_14200 [Lachnospiraceae bacterium]|nr:hypothetical protein [Lachnospiraceae bacterium]
MVIRRVEFVWKKFRGAFWMMGAPFCCGFWSYGKVGGLVTDGTEGRL